MNEVTYCGDALCIGKLSSWQDNLISDLITLWEPFPRLWGCLGDSMAKILGGGEKGREEYSGKTCPKVYPLLMYSCNCPALVPPFLANFRLIADI